MRALPANVAALSGASRSNFTSFNESSFSSNSRSSKPYSANLAGFVVAISSSFIAVPAPTLSGVRLVDKFKRRALAMVLERQLDQPVDQLRQSHSTRFPHLRVHADRGEPGNRVDLVDENLTQVRPREKIHPRHPAQSQRLEDRHGKLANPRADGCGKLRRYPRF